MKRILLAISSTFLTLILVEVAFRAVSPGAVPFERQARRLEPKGKKVDLPRLGTEEPGGSGEDRATRVLFLGDSFTAGSGLRDRSKRFTNLLAQRLEQRPVGGRKVAIVNAAVGGSSPTDWVGHLDAVRASWKPDLVLAVFFLRDGTSLSTSYRFNVERLRAIESDSAFWSGLARWSAAARWLNERRAERRFSEQLIDEMRFAYLGDEEQTSIWRKQQVALQAIRDRCQPETPFALVVFPALARLDDYPFVKVEEEIARFASESSIETYSLTEAFLGRDERKLWVAPDDQHPNDLGHEIAADRLEPFLRELLGRPKRPG